MTSGNSGDSLAGKTRPFGKVAFQSSECHALARGPRGKAGAIGRLFRRSVTSAFFQVSAMLTAKQSEELLDLLGEAAVEIANLGGPGNIVCSRLRAMQRQLQTLTTTVGELAKRIDVSPRDVLDAALEAGIQVFWHEGQQFRTPSYLHTYLAMAYHFDPVPELEIDLTPDQVQQLAAELDVEVEELTNESVGSAGVVGSTEKKAPRKFVASERTPPSVSAAKHQSG
jgi:hypothetical protein